MKKSEILKEIRKYIGYITYRGKNKQKKRITNRTYQMICKQVGNGMTI